ncbi:MAG: UvrD-helicase domain-containing protein [Candidatus Marinimicrobia bacterium]|nr:UvrD-helicase domain-containing protein [Candidatus Neomarinimicrobiota bacterium]
MIDILSGLNERQRQAVMITDGPLLIFAGAGSGKTRVLTRKIAYLLQQKKTTAHRILAVTFTNKAAKEMQGRVAEILGSGNTVNIGTFHSIGARILRNEKRIEGYSADFTIYDTKDQKSVITESLKYLELDTKMYAPSLVSHYIGEQKQQLLLPADAAKRTNNDFMKEKLAEIYFEYNKRLQANNAYDFDDLLMRPILMFREHPETAEKYRHRWDYILVDEYQDTNHVQFQLVKLFSEVSKNICVVGDDDQSIYGWRGADISNILDFEKTFPKAQIVKLEQNYRSTKNIIEAASAMIKGNGHRAEKSLWTAREEGDKILHKECERDYKESDYIAKEIRYSGKPLRDFAILYRTNAQSRLLEESLRNLGVRYVLVGGVKFYERKEIKDILAYLNILINSRDVISLKRAVKTPSRGIGEGSIKKLEDFAIQTQRTLWEAMQYPQEAGLSIAISQRVNSFMNMMESLKSQISKMAPSEFVMEILEQSQLLFEYQDKKDPELRERFENQNEFLNGVKMFETYNPDAKIEDFLQEVSLQTDIDQWEDSSDAVTLMTVHSAKGLEFKHVFISGMEEGLFPLERTRMNPKELEEERRLFYVAITRAMKNVTITSTLQRMRYGSLMGATPSTFISEIPEEFLKKDLMRKKRTFTSVSQDFTSRKSADSFFVNERPKKRPESAISPINPPKPGSITVGDRVAHKMFGKGKVRSIIRSSQVLLKITFDNGIEKTIAEKFVEKT